MVCCFLCLCFVQLMWTRPTGNSLMFAGTTLASLASGPAWPSQWCLLLELWSSTGYSCPTSSTTLDSLSTVSPPLTAERRCHIHFSWYMLHFRKCFIPYTRLAQSSSQRHSRGRVEEGLQRPLMQVGLNICGGRHEHRWS